MLLPIIFGHLKARRGPEDYKLQMKLEFSEAVVIGTYSGPSEPSAREASTMNDMDCPRDLRVGLFVSSMNHRRDAAYRA